MDYIKGNVVDVTPQTMRDGTVYYSFLVNFGWGAVRETCGGKKVPPLGMQNFICRPKSPTDNTHKFEYVPSEQ